MRRVFTLWIDGHSLKAIASKLNAEGVKAPHDGGLGNKTGRGWPHTTIRSMLSNERYRGRLIWNRTQWVKIGSRRRPIARPETEWKIIEAPDLRIIEDTIWDAAQTRFRRHSTHRGGRPHGTAHHVSLLGGLLKCGVCGGSITVIAYKLKKGVRYSTLGCNSHQTRGAAICANGKTVSTNKAVSGVVGAIQEMLNCPAMVAAFVDGFRTAIGERANSDNGTVDLKKQVAASERALRHFLDTIGKMGFSDTIAARIKEEQTKLDALKSRLAEAARQGQPRVIPHPRAIEGFLKNLLLLVQTDPVRAREALLTCLGPMVLTPTTEGYKLTGALNLAVALNAKTPEAAASGVVGNLGSGGRI